VIPRVVNFLNVVSVEEDFATLSVVETLNEGNDRGLATTGVAYQGDSLAILDINIDALENFDVRLGRVAESNIFDFNYTLFGIGLGSSHFFLFIVAGLFSWLHNQAGDFVESTLHLGHTLKIRIDIHDVEKDLPVVKKVRGDLT